MVCRSGSRADVCSPCDSLPASVQPRSYLECKFGVNGKEPSWEQKSGPLIHGKKIMGERFFLPVPSSLYLLRSVFDLKDVVTTAVGHLNQSPTYCDYY